MKIFTKTQHYDFEFESNDSNGEDYLIVDGKKINCTFNRISGNRFLLNKDNRIYRITVSKNEEEYDISVNGTPFRVLIEDEHSRIMKELIKSRAGNAGEKSLKAPIPGLIVDVFVKKSDTVKSGEALLILEAMKMENVIKAPFDCQVSEVLIKAKETVNQNQLLLKLRAL